MWGVRADRAADGIMKSIDWLRVGDDALSRRSCAPGAVVAVEIRSGIQFWRHECAQCNGG